MKTILRILTNISNIEHAVWAKDQKVYDYCVKKICELRNEAQDQYDNAEKELLILNKRIIEWQEEYNILRNAYAHKKDESGLFPCPFCRGPATLSQDTSSDYSSQWTWGVYCNNDCGGMLTGVKNEADAVEKWNKWTLNNL